MTRMLGISISSGIGLMIVIMGDCAARRCALVRAVSPLVVVVVVGGGVGSSSSARRRRHSRRTSRFEDDGVVVAIATSAIARGGFDDDDDDDVASTRRSKPPRTTTTTTKPSVVPSHLAETLDLAPLMERVSRHARTKRGRMAITGSVGRTTAATTTDARMSRFKNRRGWRRRRDRLYDASSRGGRERSGHDEECGIGRIVSVASSAEVARSEYELVREATDLLLDRPPARVGGGHRSSSSSVGIPDVEMTSSLPPMFDLFDGEGVIEDDDDDDDDWLDLILGPVPPGVDVYDEIDLRTILQAEQVTKLLLDTREWAESDGIRWRVPGLAGVARTIVAERDGGGGDDDDDDEDLDSNGLGGRHPIGPLVDLHRALEGAVEIVRAGPNLMDPNNRVSYVFRLASGNGRFSELDALRKKEERLMTTASVGSGKDNGRDLAIVRDEISTMENLVERGLILAMIRAAPAVNRGMDALARLDSIFARASYGIDWNGSFPVICTEGRLRVDGFVHPVLALRREVDGGGVREITPIDLLIPGRGEGHRALVISGPNGGGKTLALKSFGMAAMMAKLAIPITVARNADDGLRPPIVDYFDDILVEVGDSQSIRRQESTLMARLNSLSTLIERMNTTSSGDEADTRLILLDELGGGTDPVAGSALAQSIMEKLVSMDSDCSIVATTHSPQLKALSMSDCRFESASVLMNDEKHPSFRLSYGSTGESFALEAAMRASPSLPDDVIERAAELMNGGDDVAVNSLRRYLSALEQEQRKARELVQETEATYREVLQYKEDTISKIKVSRMHLSRLESRLGNIFDILKGSEGGTYELVGDSLEELRLLKRRLKSEEEILSEKGLRRVPDSYSFYEGEKVVIISDSEFKGYDAVVKRVDAEDPLVVTVVPVLDLFSFNENDIQETLALRRKDVAIFDYPKWGFTSTSDDKYEDSHTERKKSRNKLMSVLSTLSTASETKSIIAKEETPLH
ncbi:hypothetical protein ACHAXA_005809 [Cyclostephanos tholiformis]|uniref:DNA mismatch repair proteins mutS family domain-containing protein n=1 Tax=Cyclostephanos tholiformis TaxID=382380 RepID=A0ABD3R9U1_9STRA